MCWDPGWRGYMVPIGTGTQARLRLATTTTQTQFTNWASPDWQDIDCMTKSTLSLYRLYGGDSFYFTCEMLPRHTDHFSLAAVGRPTELRTEVSSFLSKTLVLTYLPMLTFPFTSFTRRSWDRSTFMSKKCRHGILGVLSACGWTLNIIREQSDAWHLSQ